MQPGFQLVAGHLALDFANTLDYRFDPQRRVDLLGDYGSLLRFARQAGVITEAQAKRLLSHTSPARGSVALGRATGLREAIDALFRSIVAGEPPRASCFGMLRRFLKNPPATETLLWRGSAYIRAYSNLAARPDALLGPIVEAAADLLTSARRHSIRECADPSCRWLFLDQSKNHSRRWCKMAICGNRSKVKRFRARSEDPALSL